MLFRPLLVLSLLWLSAAASAQAPTYTAVRIDLPPAFRPQAVNAQGDLVGHKLEGPSDLPETPRVAFRQYAGQNKELIGDLEGGALNASYQAINDAGLAAGYGSVEPKTDPRKVRYFGYRAIVQARGGEPLDLSPWLPADVDSTALAVNAAGQVLGTFYLINRTNGDIIRKPFVWSEQGGMRFPFGSKRDGVYLRVYDMNDAGHIAGIDRRGSHHRAFIWDAARGFRYLRGRIGYVTAINNLDQVVGTDEFRKAYVWNGASGKIILPPLYPDRALDRCEAIDINDGGVIVGHCSDEPVVWTPDGAGGYVVDKLAMRIEPGGSMPPGTEVVVQQIDNAGRILVNTSVFRELKRAYCLVPNGS